MERFLSKKQENALKDKNWEEIIPEEAYITLHETDEGFDDICRVLGVENQKSMLVLCVVAYTNI